VQEPRIERRLAAILASDVAGYSRLMEGDEVGTMRALRAHRKELIDSLIASYHGRIVKTTGDGILAEFASAVDATGFAVAVQRGMAERNANVPLDRRIVFRIGINVGDIIVDGDDIYGDGVNVAARLEALAEPGGICISEDVHRQVRNKLTYEFADKGEQMVKNIARPVRVYAFAATAVLALPQIPAQAEQRASPTEPARGRRWLWPAGAGIAAVALAVGIWLAIAPTKRLNQSETAPRFSIVVLPFVNLSGDPAQAYLADVLTDELTTSLARISGTFVIARSTAFTYKGKPVDVKQVGKDLGVRYVLEGSEQHDGNHVRMNAQLIDAETGAHLWADQFEADRSDLLQMQDEIVTRIARAMQIQLLGVDVARVSRARPSNLDAEDLALRCQAGTYNAQGVTAEIMTALKLCERALQIDDRNVLALTLVAYKYMLPVIEAQSTDPQADIRQADELVSRAVTFDPNYYLAHFAKGHILMGRKRSEEAVVEFERTLALNPSFIEAYLGLCIASNFLGRPDRTLELADKAIRLSPRDPFLRLLYHLKGWAFFMKQQDDQAIEWLGRAEGATPFTELILASALALAGRQVEAHKTLERYMATIGVTSTGITQLRAQVLSFGDSPTWHAYAERLFEGLRKAGMPE
jgi:adenylate cyclase